ncbi:hypothetical protein F4779DRAFT_616175 [Xylariaceae sp. FL0662B]|nr:hypothetical protein F4779DRAFT_616175 [Xylariaceae sp. FL0662B]
MDEDTTLIIQLLREDAQEAESIVTGKGKEAEGSETDMQIAFKLFQEELLHAETFFPDQQMATSIQKAVQLDSDALIQFQEEERAAQDDRNMALALNNGGHGTLTSKISLQTSLSSFTDDEDFLEKLFCIFVTGIDPIDSDYDICDDEATIASGQPESSTKAASRQPTTRQRRTCEACGSIMHFAELATAPCQHEYCRQCLTHLFHEATVNESLFPPRCCKQPIPLDRNRLFLDPDVVREFCKKSLEYSTPRRTYCHNRHCATFIPPKNYVDDVATCGECGCQTCITCKNSQHGGECPNDEQLQQVIQLAGEKGWQRCQDCRRMIELISGSAVVGPNSAMFAVLVGRPVVANMGKSVACTSALLRSIHSMKSLKSYLLERRAELR